ncbi:hypothetical protein EVAR_69460_1 [Eumeta japonica]|uniref:Uncharacterized protein n=1 Tax=Eumeta variegata TaxID=151549 RepID=A0A4C2A7V2_EUMVA|nr:hypothetical protein EVAR_69460_1 [Eumeta japonica]
MTTPLDETRKKRKATKNVKKCTEKKHGISSSLSALRVDISVTACPRAPHALFLTRKNNFAKETIVIEVPVSEKNSSELKSENVRNKTLALSKMIRAPKPAHPVIRDPHATDTVGMFV